MSAPTQASLAAEVARLDTERSALLARLGPALLDDPAEAQELEAAIEAAESAILLARAELKRIAEAEAARAERERVRQEALAAELRRRELLAFQAELAQRLSVARREQAEVLEARIAWETRRAEAVAAIDWDRVEVLRAELRDARVSFADVSDPGSVTTVEALIADAERLEALAAEIGKVADLSPVLDAAAKARAEVAASRAIAGKRSRLHDLGQKITDLTNRRQTALVNKVDRADTQLIDRLEADRQSAEAERALLASELAQVG